MENILLTGLIVAILLAFLIYTVIRASVRMYFKDKEAFVDRLHDKLKYERSHEDGKGK